MPIVRPALAALLFLLGQSACAQTVRIGVLGLFHPGELVVSPARSEAIVLNVHGERLVLEPGPPPHAARILLSGIAMRIEFAGRSFSAGEVGATSLAGGEADLQVTIPGRITRRYRGTLSITQNGGELVPIVNMDLETAVASAVQAESAPNTPEEALKAQAVVSRSYYAARKGAHRLFDFCDLTHCQSLREPPEMDSGAARAALATKGLILTYEGKPVATMFTRSCAGRTLTPAQAGLPGGEYPFFSVRCDYCHGSPVKWTRTISREDAALLLKRGEAGRLAVDRRLGWNAVPSNSFAAQTEDGQVVLHGTGQGHGIGLCQRGAEAMAKEGATFREILAHYFPNTTVSQFPES